MDRPTRVMETYKAYPTLQRALPETGELIAYIEQLEAALAHYAVEPGSDAHYALYCGCLHDGIERSALARQALAGDEATHG